MKLYWGIITCLLFFIGTETQAIVKKKQGLHLNSKIEKNGAFHVFSIKKYRIYIPDSVLIKFKYDFGEETTKKILTYPSEKIIEVNDTTTVNQRRMIVLLRRFSRVCSIENIRNHKVLNKITYVVRYHYNKRISEMYIQDDRWLFKNQIVHVSGALIVDF